MFCQKLSDSQIQKIHRASIAILEGTGVVIPHDDMRKRLEASGARVDHVNERVRIPESLVMDCLSSAGKQFTLYGRDLNKVAKFGQGFRNYNTIAGEAYWVDQIGTDRRFATLADVATASRFADALEEITIVGAMSDPHELGVEARCAQVLAEQVRHTTKPVTFWFHDRLSASFIVEMLIALRGDEQRATAYPLCYPFLEPISPLRFPMNGIDLLYETARLNLPVPIGPMAQMGLSAPCSLAGTLALENAEILAGICITQMIRRGMPICYGGICHAFDLRTTQMIFGGPEQAIFGVAMTQMGKHYGLPVYINVGLTDSKRPDGQAGIESGITLAMGAAAGADIFGHMGICGVDQATSLDILLLQHEVIRFVERTMRPMDLSDTAIGLTAIEDVSPGGTFIDHEHTVEHFRRELWFPHLLDRQYYQAWQDTGASSMEQRLCERKEQILRDHQPDPPAPEVSRELDRIVRSARKTLMAR